MASRKRVSADYAFSKNSGPSTASARPGHRAKGGLARGAVGSTPGQVKVGSESKRPKTVD